MSEVEWMTEEYREAGRYLTVLMGSALTGKKALKKPETVDWKKVDQLAEYHHVSCLAYYGLISLEDSPEHLVAKWKSATEMAIYRKLHFDLEREAIQKEMEKHNLSYMPVKGVIISELYPYPGMRDMADNDILYGFVKPMSEGGYQLEGDTPEERLTEILKAQKILVALMRKRGYAVKGLTGNHDVYQKPPFFNFEMHRMLMAPNSIHYSYYENPWKHAVLFENNSYHFHFSLEDEYIFFLVHTFKHFDNSGCGLRCLADLWVFHHLKEKKLDWKIISRELIKLDLADFEAKLWQLAQEIFSNFQISSPQLKVLFDYLLASGTYGNMEIQIQNKMDRLSKENSNRKKEYLRSRIFLNEQIIKTYFPTFYRYRFLRPLLPLYRMGKGLLLHPSKLWREWRYVRRI